MRRAGFLLLIVAVAGLAVVLMRSRKPVSTVLTGPTMGTTYTVRIADPLTPAQQQRWQYRVQQCLDDINSRMSTYRADSEVSCFNRSTSTDWYSVSGDTAAVVAMAQQVAQQTDGAFDVTVGPLVNLWNFGPDRRPVGIPSDAEIAAAQEHVGFRLLDVQLDPPALRKVQPELTIDLSGIAKGYAVDQVSELLRSEAVEAFMVEVGGEVCTRGRKSDGTPWRIGLERPLIGQRQVQSVLELEDCCLATSGDYRNVYEWEGQLYSHEIDPATGRPVQHGVAAVSVIASSAMQADAFATALMVVPRERTWHLASELGLEIMVIVRDQDGLRRRATPGFEKAIAEELNTEELNTEELNTEEMKRSRGVS